MKYILFLFLPLVSLACQSKPTRYTENLSLPYSEWNIGEYSQVWDETSIATFIRSPESPYRGLVRLNWKTYKLELLDSAASEGRDLSLDGEEAIYRLGNQIVWISGKQRRVFEMGAESIRGFHAHPHFLEVYFEGSAKESVSLCFDREGEILSHQILDKRLIRSHRDKERDVTWVLHQADEGLLLSEMQACTGAVTKSYIVDEEARTEHALIGLRPNSKVYVAFLSEFSGVLFYGEQPESGSHFQLERVDGATGETYRGMDLVAFEEEDSSRPSLLYLDAWSLELRLARFKNGDWTSQVLPVKGSVGFFNQVLGINSGRLIGLTNSFRTQHTKFEVTDDDLILYQWDLATEELIPWAHEEQDKSRP